jgi:hypothetical protein
MAEWQAIDSRDYIVALELSLTNDCPPDFELPATVAGFETGLFLPRGDRDWFGRPSYPPRVLLLKRRTLYIISHPSAGEQTRQCAMDQITSVESGHMLLKGWLRFTGLGFDYTVRYNTRGFQSVFQFMHRFRHELLPSAGSRGSPQSIIGLDIKFGNALTGELDSGETVLVQVFRPPSEVRSCSWLLPRSHWISGDLLALTSRRLLWITDRERGSYSRYGSIASFAPFGAVLGIGSTSGRGGQILKVDLNDGSTWQIPISPENLRVAEEFAGALELQKRPKAGRTQVRR